LVLVWKLKEDGEEAEELFNDFGVTFLRLLLVGMNWIKEVCPNPAEGLDFLDVVGEDRGLRSLVVTVKLWQVVHLNIILDTIA